MKIILLHPQLKRIIKDEFNCSKQTVDMSLGFVFKSDKAKQIRLRAKDLLIEEIEKIDLDISAYEKNH